MTRTRSFGSGARVGHDASEYYKRGLKPIWHRDTSGAAPDAVSNPGWLDEVRELRERRRAIEERLAHIYWTTPLAEVSLALEEDGWEWDGKPMGHSAVVRYAKDGRDVLAPCRIDPENYYARRTHSVANVLLDDDEDTPEGVLSLYENGIQGGLV